MKKLARAMLRGIINDLSIPQSEYGQAMLAELEETNGLQALVWASGGIQLWAQARGGEIMKNASFWFGLVAIGILAGGLYVTKGLYWAIPVVVIGVISFAAFRPRDAVPVALLLGSSLPIAELIRVWTTLKTVLANLNYANGSLTGNLFTVQSPDITSTNQMLISGAVTILFDDQKAKDFSTTLEGFGTMDQLPQLTAAVLIGAIVIAGLSAFIRSRVVARNMISRG
jgi:hypothetical protein